MKSSVLMCNILYIMIIIALLFNIVSGEDSSGSNKHVF